MRVILFLAAIVCAFSAFALTDVERKYLYGRKRIVSQKLEGDKVITTYIQKAKMWSVTNQVKQINEPIALPKKYSKLKLIVAAKEAGKWETLKSAIQSLGLEDEWQACQFISSDYPAYIAATNAVITRGIASEKAVQEFMKKAED
jgi:hypothetical protein